MRRRVLPSDKVVLGLWHWIVPPLMMVLLLLKCVVRSGSTPLLVIEHFNPLLVLLCMAVSQLLRGVLWVVER